MCASSQMQNIIRKRSFVHYLKASNRTNVMNKTDFCVEHLFKAVHFLALIHVRMICIIYTEIHSASTS